ncbi:hypothetical protein SAMN05443582_106185 [Phyllobacterium sp. OV277]|nr:hypothetical protein SAMN05443582_106185 [Phyllobacterium sp. OV277]
MRVLKGNTAQECGGWCRERGSWFDKLTMRESGDATLIAKIAVQRGCRTCLPFITPLPHGELVEPRTTLPAPSIAFEAQRKN